MPRRRPRPGEQVALIAMHATDGGAITHTYHPWVGAHFVRRFTAHLEPIDVTMFRFGHSVAAAEHFADHANALVRGATFTKEDAS